MCMCRMCGCVVDIIVNKFNRIAAPIFVYILSVTQQKSRDNNLLSLSCIFIYIYILLARITYIISYTSIWTDEQELPTNTIHTPSCLASRIASYIDHSMQQCCMYTFS